MPEGIDVHTFICAYHANERGKHYMDVYKKNPEAYLLAMEYIRTHLS